MRATANRSLNISPAWSPNGRALAFTSWALGFVDIFVMGFEGQAPARPARGSDGFMNSLPAYSPDGSKIAFVSTRSGNSDIYVMNADGTDLRNLTNNEAIDNAPTWSPTGAQIAFISNRTGGRQLWVITADGGAPFVLTSGSDIDRPSWSPVGNLIAYTCGSAPGHDICIIDITTRAITVLTDSRGDNQSPSFAPNGRHVVFKTTRFGREQIAVIAINGKTPRQITQAGNNTYPSWSASPGGR
jgi:TolB protein